MKIKTILFAMALCCIINSYAQDNLRIILSSETELTGYIARQRPGANITFAADKAVVILDESPQIVDRKVKVNELSPQWKQWADENNAIVGVGSESYLVLSDVIGSKETISGVRILERGAKLKYLDLTPRECSLPVDTIAIIKAEPRPQLQLSGVNRRYKLKNGLEYDGQYVEEVPGKTLSLYQQGGTVYVVNRNEVIKDVRYGINPNQTLFEQSALIDIVFLKDGTTKRGIIVERNYSTDRGYIVIEDESGLQQQSIALSDVVEYRKERNGKYAPQTDIALGVGEYAVNRIPAYSIAAKETAQGGTTIIYFNSDSIQTTIDADESNYKVTVETKLAQGYSTSQFTLVRADGYSDKKNQHGFYGFTFEQLVKDAILPIGDVTVSTNGITKWAYSLTKSGVYALYDRAHQVIIPFSVSRSTNVGVTK